MYALLATLGVASFLCWLRLVERGGWRTAALYAVVTAAALYSHYYAAFLLPAELINQQGQVVQKGEHRLMVPRRPAAAQA